MDLLIEATKQYISRTTLNEAKKYFCQAGDCKKEAKYWVYDKADDEEGNPMCDKHADKHVKEKPTRRTTAIED